MKKILQYWPYALALLPQFIFTDYRLVMAATVLIGMAAALLAPQRRVFGKMFGTELIVFSVVFFLFRDRVFYLHDVVRSLELPDILVTLVPPVFNALNVAILFYTGYKLVGLFPRRMAGAQR